ncbi:hypothetical protein HPB48_006970 [Haemaphysalis longicornis]|uniref:Uncharacterized protein n=1 Tax=Haemaphysalis longicornis TaxID=44386 RepID=A0A9J6FCQ6_HAELO|nr:hypothetical protein HPB48_006970 [Haemaphysalis longicornis]
MLTQLPKGFRDHHLPLAPAALQAAHLRCSHTDAPRSQQLCPSQRAKKYLRRQQVGRRLDHREETIMRRKNELVNHSAFRCCFCCHVRTGTVIVGVWHLVLHVLALAVLVSMMVRPELFDKLYGSGGTTATHLSGSFLTRFRPTLYSHPEGGPPTPDMPLNDPKLATIREEDLHVALAITVCTGVITLLLLYGTIWGQPTYLMPFFCLQVFDFVLSALTVVGYFSYTPDVRRLVAASRDLPLQKELLRLDPQWLCTVVMIGFVACMMLKVSACLSRCSPTPSLRCRRVSKKCWHPVSHASS